MDLDLWRDYKCRPKHGRLQENGGLHASQGGWPKIDYLVYGGLAVFAIGFLLGILAGITIAEWT